MSYSITPSRLLNPNGTGVVAKIATLAIHISLIALGLTLLAADGVAPSRPQRGTVDSFRGPKPTQVNLFIGGGDKSAPAQGLTKELGVTAYSPNMVLTLEQFTNISIAALKREGREVSFDFPCSANIELSTGELTMFFRTKQEWCYVSFDSSGRTTRVAGAVGNHGEGGWHREYKNGLPIGPSNISSVPTNQPPSSPPPNR